MARNEEKQQGRLNRLWLQKEREEGRLKDVHAQRPKLSTLNSASSVKKWIPSIKNEIEYYLQQSQLSHYPERKIAEFQLHIEALEKEYKRFITKVRVLDPSCKYKPWTPRAYSKRRADQQDSPCTVKIPRHSETHDDNTLREGESDLAKSWTGSHQTSTTERQKLLSQSESRFPTHVPSSSVTICTEDQDQPLSFDKTRLAVAAAAFRGSSVHLGSSQAQSLAQVLQSGLPNLVNSASRQRVSIQSSDSLHFRESNDKPKTKGPAYGQKDAALEQKSDCDVEERNPEESLRSGMIKEKAGHLLGLDCYSSSDEEFDTLHQKI